MYYRPNQCRIHKFVRTSSICSVSASIHINSNINKRIALVWYLSFRSPPERFNLPIYDFRRRITLLIQTKMNTDMSLTKFLHSLYRFIARTRKLEYLIKRKTGDLFTILEGWPNFVVDSSFSVTIVFSLWWCLEWGFVSWNSKLGDKNLKYSHTEIPTQILHLQAEQTHTYMPRFSSFSSFASVEVFWETVSSVVFSTGRSLDACRWKKIWLHNLI